MNFFKYLILAIILMLPTLMKSQCNIAIVLPTADTTICEGDTIQLFADGSCNYFMNNNFNNQTIGVGWSSTNANPVFTNPCGPGPNGSYLWVGTTASPQRTLVTNSYDLSLNGCRIEWWMKYGIDPSSGACEDPDASNEGVHLQYSTNNGATWTDFPGPNLEPVGTNTATGPFMNPSVTTTPGSGGYWQPHSSLSTQQNSELYYWHQYENNIPAAASTTNTRIRWAQLSNSSAGWDAWGIDEVKLFCPGNGQNVIWSTGDTGFVTKHLTPNKTTTYSVLIFDSLSNFAVTNITVNVLPKPDPNLINDTIICDDAFILSSDTFDSYLWNTNETTNSIVVDSSAEYTVKVTDGACVGYDTVNVEIAGLPISDAGLDQEICKGDTAILIGDYPANYNFYWEGGDSNTQFNVNPFQDSSFVFVVYYKHCIGHDSVNVTVNPLPNIKLPNDTNICKNDFITIKAENGISYIWNNGKTTPSITEEIMSKTQFSVTGYDNNACENSDTIIVGVYPLPKIVLKSNKADYCIGDTVIIIASGAETYYWNGNSSDSIIKFLANYSTDVYVEGVDSNSCLNSNTIDIFIEDCVVLYFPNSFTPDGDGLNDIFKPEGDFTGIINYDFLIFNRWGELLFKTNDFNEGWDGYFKGEKKAGVYVYKLKYKTLSGKVFEKAGTVILLN